MAILADMKAFYRWLDQANEDELAKRRNAALQALRSGLITDATVTKEAKRLIRKIEEEMLIRKMSL